MNDRVFIDTNIFVYAKLNAKQDQDKQERARTFLRDLTANVVISTQVLSEFANVLLKHGLEDEIVQTALTEMVEVTSVLPISLTTVQNALEIKRRYHFSYWDSLIITSALEGQCSLLFTEDLQDGQVIENRLQIKNPFLML